MLIAQGLERKTWIIYNNVAVDHNLIRTCDGMYFTNKFLADSLPVANRVLKHPLPLFKELLFQGLSTAVIRRAWNTSVSKETFKSKQFNKRAHLFICLDSAAV